MTSISLTPAVFGMEPMKPFRNGLSKIEVLATFIASKRPTTDSVCSMYLRYCMVCSTPHAKRILRANRAYLNFAIYEVGISRTYCYKIAAWLLLDRNRVIAFIAGSWKIICAFSIRNLD
jgi:hypothetical protein